MEQTIIQAKIWMGVMHIEKLNNLKRIHIALFHSYNILKKWQNYREEEQTSARQCRDWVEVVMEG